MFSYSIDVLFIFICITGARCHEQFRVGKSFVIVTLVVSSRVCVFSGIVGAGIGGSSVAYWLRQSFGEHVQLDIYTDETRVGGRLATMQIDGKDYEIGGSIIHPDNYYMIEWLREFGMCSLSFAVC